MILVGNHLVWGAGRHSWGNTGLGIWDKPDLETELEMEALGREELSRGRERTGFPRRKRPPRSSTFRTQETKQNQRKMGKSREVGGRPESGSVALGLMEKGSSEVSAAADPMETRPLHRHLTCHHHMEPPTSGISHEIWVRSDATSEESLRWN